MEGHFSKKLQAFEVPLVWLSLLEAQNSKDDRSEINDGSDETHVFQIIFKRQTKWHLSDINDWKIENIIKIRMWKGRANHGPRV